MGDFLKKNQIFTKIGFDESNQWLLYHEPLQKFFQWIADNVTDDNILTDEDIYETNRLKSIGQWYEGEELEKRMKNLEEQYPGIMTYTDDDVNDLEEEVEILKKTENDYLELIPKLEQTLNQLKLETADLELAVQEEEKRAEKAFQEVATTAKELEEKEREKFNTINELHKCYSETQNPPLFMHEMPLEEFFNKIDASVQYVTMYLNNNLKIKTASDSSEDDEEKNQAVEKLEALERQIYAAELRLEEEKLFAAGYEDMIKGMDVSRIQAMSPIELKKEVFETPHNDQQQFSISYDALMSELKHEIRNSVEERIEDILYDNTKRKLERAVERLEKLKGIEEAVSQMLNYSELLWFAMQLDLEKIKNYNDIVTTPPNNDNDLITRRIEAMLQCKSMSLEACREKFVDSLAEEMAKNLNIPKPESLSACAYEFDKSNRKAESILKGIIEKKFYRKELKAMEEFKSIEKIYTSFIFDGPVNRPMLVTVEFIKPIHISRATKVEIERTIRQIRCDIQTNITEKMTSDRFYRYLQLLWIWFLTEPKKVLQAIDEAKKTAADPVNFKRVSGFRRKVD